MAKLPKAKWDSVARLAIRTLMTSGVTPNRVIKVLRPPELAYLCDICDVLRTLRICDDVFFDDEGEDEDAETDN